MNTKKVFPFSFVLAGIFFVSSAQETFDVFVASNRGISQPKLSYLVRQTVKPPVALRRDRGHSTNYIPQRPNNVKPLPTTVSRVQFRRQAMKNMFYNHSNSDGTNSHKRKGGQHPDATGRPKHETKRFLIDKPSSSFSNRNVRSSKSRSILAKMFKKIRGFRDIVPPNNRLQRPRDISSYWPDIANDKLQPIVNDGVYQEEDFRVFRGNGNVFLPPTSTSRPALYTKIIQSATTQKATSLATTPPLIVKKERKLMIPKEIVGEHKIETFSDSDNSQHRLPIHYNVLNPSTESVPDISSQSTTNKNRSKGSQDLVVSFIKYNKTSLSNFSFEDKKLPENIKDVNIQSTIDETLKGKSIRSKGHVHIVIHKFPYNSTQVSFKKGKIRSRGRKHINQGKLYKDLLQLTKPIPLDQLSILSAGELISNKTIRVAEKPKQIKNAAQLGREEIYKTTSIAPEFQQVQNISVTSRSILSPKPESKTNGGFDVNIQKTSESDTQQANNAQNSNVSPKFRTPGSREKPNAINIENSSRKQFTSKVDSKVFIKESKLKNRTSFTNSKKEGHMVIPMTEKSIKTSSLKTSTRSQQNTTPQPLGTSHSSMKANNQESTVQTKMSYTTSHQPVFTSTQSEINTEFNLTSKSKAFSAEESLATKEDINGLKDTPATISANVSTGKQNEVTTINIISTSEDNATDNVENKILPSNMTVKLDESKNIANNTFSGGDSFDLEAMSDYIEEFVHLKNATKNKNHRYLNTNNADFVDKQTVVGIKIEEEKLKLSAIKMKNNKSLFDDLEVGTINDRSTKSTTKTQPSENILKSTKSTLQQQTTPLTKPSTEMLLSQKTTTRTKGLITTEKIPTQINETLPKYDTSKAFSMMTPITSAEILSDTTKDINVMSAKSEAPSSVTGSVDLNFNEELSNKTVVNIPKGRQQNSTQFLVSPVIQKTINNGTNNTTTMKDTISQKSQILSMVKIKDSKIYSSFPANIKTIKSDDKTKQPKDYKQTRKPKIEKTYNSTKNESQNSGKGHTKTSQLNNTVIDERLDEIPRNRGRKKTNWSETTMDITGGPNNIKDKNSKQLEEESMDERKEKSMKKTKVSMSKTKIRESAEHSVRVKTGVKTKNSSSTNGKNRTNVKADIGQKNPSQRKDLVVGMTKDNDDNVNTKAKTKKKETLQEKQVSNTTQRTSERRNKKRRKNSFPKMMRDNKRSKIESKQETILQDTATPIRVNLESNLSVDETNGTVAMNETKEKMKGIQEITTQTLESKDIRARRMKETNQLKISDEPSMTINKTQDGKTRNEKVRKKSSQQKKIYIISKFETISRNISQEKETPIKINREDKNNSAMDTNIRKEVNETLNVKVDRYFEMKGKREKKKTIKMDMNSLSPAIEQNKEFNKTNYVENENPKIHSRTSTKSLSGIEKEKHSFVGKIKATKNEVQATKEKQTSPLKITTKKNISDRKNTRPRKIIRNTIENLKNDRKGRKENRLEEARLDDNKHHSENDKGSSANGSNSTTNKSSQSNTPTTKWRSSTDLNSNTSKDKQSNKSNPFPDSKKGINVEMKNDRTVRQNSTASEKVTSSNITESTNLEPIENKTKIASMTFGIQTTSARDKTPQDLTRGETLQNDPPNIYKGKNATKKSILTVIVPTKMVLTKVISTTPSSVLSSRIHATPLEKILTKPSKKPAQKFKEKIEGQKKYEKSPEKNHFVIKDDFENNLSFQIPLELMTTVAPNINYDVLSSKGMDPSRSFKIEKKIPQQHQEIPNKRSDIDVISNPSQIPITTRRASKEEIIGSKSKIDMKHETDKNSMKKDVKYLIPPPPPLIPTTTIASATEKIIQFIGKASDLVKKLNGKKNEFQDVMSQTNMNHLNGNTLQPVFKLSKTEQKIDILKSTSTVTAKDTTPFPTLPLSKTPDNFKGSDKDLGKGQRISAIFTRPERDLGKGIRPSAFDSRLNNVYDFGVPRGIYAKDVNGKPSLKGKQPFVEWLARGKNGQVKGIPPEILTNTKQMSRRKVLDSSNSSIPDILKSNLDSKTYSKPKMPFMNPLRNLQKYPNSGSCNSSLGKEEIMSLAVNVLRLLVSNLKLQQALQQTHEHIVSTQFHSRRYLLIPLPEDDKKANKTNLPKIGKYTIPSSNSIQHQIETFLNRSSLNANLAVSPLIKRKSLRSDRNESLTSHDESVIQNRKSANYKYVTKDRQIHDKSSLSDSDKVVQNAERDKIQSKTMHLKGRTKTVGDEKSDVSKARIQFH